METDQLKSFISVAQTLSFSEAAHRNYISQPAISHHIDSLERQFGVKLFQRSTRGVSLTTAGVEFLPCAVEILNMLQTAELKLQRIKSGTTESINIYAIPTARPLLLKCVEAYSQRYPNTFLNVKFVNGAEQDQAIFNENCDFSFACLSALPSMEDIDYFSVQRIGFSLVMPKGHPLLCTPLDYKALSKVPFISIVPAEGPLLNEQILTICKNRHLVPHITTYYNEAYAVLISVAAGIGISILPKPLLADYPSENVVAIDITGDDAYYDLYICWKKSNHNQAAIKFRNLLYEMFPERIECQTGEQ